MSNYQMKAKILLILENNNFSYMFELRRYLKQHNPYLLILLDEDRSFSNRVKNYLFNKRLGVVFYG